LSPGAFPPQIEFASWPAGSSKVRFPPGPHLRIASKVELLANQVAIESQLGKDLRDEMAIAPEHRGAQDV